MNSKFTEGGISLESVGDYSDNPFMKEDMEYDEIETYRERLRGLYHSFKDKFHGKLYGREINVDSPLELAVAIYLYYNSSIKKK